jgi:hypothetical protein
MPAALAGDSVAAPDVAPTATAEEHLNAAVGCKTNQVALALLAQIMQLEHENLPAASEEQLDKGMLSATAMLAELQPTNATEAMLAAQMIGTQRAAMRFLTRATLAEQTFQGADANVLRATRLMRVFNEQVETMAKLKGKSGQQRVVVEHVTVAAGGQAIVGTVIPGGRGTDVDNG